MLQSAPLRRCRPAASGRSSVVERQLPKLYVVSSILIARSNRQRRAFRHDGRIRGKTRMRKVLVAALMLPFAQAASAQAAGDAAAGKAYWDRLAPQIDGLQGLPRPQRRGRLRAGSRRAWIECRPDRARRSQALGHHAGLHRKPGQRQGCGRSRRLFRLVAEAGGRPANGGSRFRPTLLRAKPP